MWGLARPVAADTVSAVTMLAHHNAMRFAIGAPTLVGDPRVTLAAQRHADYSSLNGVGGHYEVAGNPGYSGYSPRDRVAAAGLSTAFVSEVAASYTGALNAMTELWHAPYHRLGMMHPSARALLLRDAALRIRLPGHHPAAPAGRRDALPRPLRHHRRGPVRHE